MLSISYCLKSRRRHTTQCMMLSAFWQWWFDDCTHSLQRDWGYPVSPYIQWLNPNNVIYESKFEDQFRMAQVESDAQKSNLRREVALAFTTHETLSMQNRAPFKIERSNEKERDNAGPWKELPQDRTPSDLRRRSRKNGYSNWSSHFAESV